MTNPDQMNMSQIGRAWALGTDLVINLIAGGLLGYGLDWIFGTGPILMVVFGLFGLAFGMLRFIRDALKFNREMTMTGQEKADGKKSDE